jgi:site-specific DNA-methyltransferase (adenine-specific)
MEYLVRIYCPTGGVCLDPHIGSGTTAIACLNTSRNFIGIDNDQKSVKESIDFIQRNVLGELY